MEEPGHRLPREREERLGVSSLLSLCVSPKRAGSGWAARALLWEKTRRVVAVLKPHPSSLLPSLRPQSKEGAGSGHVGSRPCSLASSALRPGWRNKAMCQGISHRLQAPPDLGCKSKWSQCPFAGVAEPSWAQQPASLWEQLSSITQSLDGLSNTLRVLLSKEHLQAPFWDSATG